MSWCVVCAFETFMTSRFNDVRYLGFVVFIMFYIISVQASFYIFMRPSTLDLEHNGFYIHVVLYTCSYIYMQFYILVVILHVVLYTCSSIYMQFYIHVVLYTCSSIYQQFYIHVVLYIVSFIIIHRAAEYSGKYVTLNILNTHTKQNCFKYMI